MDNPDKPGRGRKGSRFESGRGNEFQSDPERKESALRKSKAIQGRGRELRKKRNTKTRQPTPCRHCGLMGRRPKGLCWKCFSTPEINQQYQTQSKYHPNHMEKDFDGKAPLGSPTQALPGSEEKLQAMEDRARRGFAIFHPQDARLELADDIERRMRAMGLLRGSDDTFEEYDDAQFAS